MTFNLNRASARKLVMFMMSPVFYSKHEVNKVGAPLGAPTRFYYAICFARSPASLLAHRG